MRFKSINIQDVVPVFLLILFVVFSAFLVFDYYNIDSFEECARDQPVFDSKPGQCTADDGIIYIEGEN